MLRRSRLAGGAVAALLALALPASAAAQSPPIAPWDGTNPFNCVEQDVGTGTEFPDPGADPFCVKFDKTNQNVTDFGIVDFAAQEPARVAAAGTKCFYFQNDHWTGSIQQGQEPETWNWEGRYFFDRAKGIGGVSVTDFRVGGTPFDATPYVPPEYAGYFAPNGGGGVIVTEETDPDPSCTQKVDTEEERAAVYAGLPDFGNCVAPGGKIRARKVGRARLGATPDAGRARRSASGRALDEASATPGAWSAAATMSVQLRERRSAPRSGPPPPGTRSAASVPVDARPRSREAGFARVENATSSPPVRGHRSVRPRRRRHGACADGHRRLAAVELASSG